MDEHGQKMQQTAAREGLTPLALADRTAMQFEEMGDLLNARADDIVRTTSARHREAVQDIWKRMEANGDIYLSKYSGWYSVRDEAYYDEDEIEEREGKKYSTKTGTPVEWVEEESYFFKLSAYAKPLLDYYEAHPEFIVPEKYKNEIVAFVKRGLNDLSISRTTFDWGIPCSGQPEACDVCVGGCAHQLYHGHRVSGREGRQGEILAGQRPCDRQGHYTFPRDLLASVFDVGKAAGAQADCGTRISLQPRRENVEVGWQCGGAG